MGNAAGLELSDVREGYDIGYRIGNAGVSSQMGQLGLSMIGSYFDGGASATVSRSPDGTASIMMVSPPDAAKLAGQAVHWKDRLPCWRKAGGAGLCQESIFFI